MNADATDLIRARTAAAAWLHVAIDAGRSMGYREGLEVGRRAGKVEALRENARQLRSADGVAFGHLAQSIDGLADRIERGEQA